MSSGGYKPPIDKLSHFHEFHDSTLANIWIVILRPNAAEDEQYKNKIHNWRRPVSIQGLLFGQPRIWNSWGYKAAYPKLALFLDKASLENKFRSQVILEEVETSNDCFQRRKLRYNEAHAPLSVLFDVLKTFPTQAEEAKPFTEKNLGTTPLITRLVKILHITDISPVVLSCILGTSSSIDISHIVSFVDKNLKGLNWAKVNLLQIRHMGWSSFIYEYHFSFYYVTLDYVDTNTIKPDPRKARKSCTFGQAKNTKHRYIHEETVSFLLCGHFNDVFSCYQLVDAYFKPRYTKSTGPRVFRSYDPKQSPGQFMLYWIAVALFHARSRWENAIDALDSEIKSPSDVVFMEDRNDLMADDPQFSLSKTYFWALQTYKLFERTLEQTIDTWETFKNESLPKIRDGRISREDWDAAVGSIDQAMDHLKLKLDRVRRGIQDVKDLREGLQSTAAVFDSRTAVRQGENIRLLTYITLLFLPLSFGTSIFGMQIITPSPDAIKAFAITLPSLTLLTFILLTNLNTLLSFTTSVVQNLTLSLQVRMRQHHLTHWQHRALALHQDHLATAPPARKVEKKSSRWVYALFILESLLVLVPVFEIDCAAHLYGVLREGKEEEAEEEGKDHGNRDGEGNVDSEHLNSNIDNSSLDKKKKEEIQRKVKTAARLAKEAERKEQEKEQGILISTLQRLRRGSLKFVRVVIRVVFNLFRFVFLPIWIILLFVEYIMVLIVLLALNGGFATPDAKRKQPLSSSKDKEGEEETKDLKLISIFSKTSKILSLNTISIPRFRITHAPLSPSPPSANFPTIPISKTAFELVRSKNVFNQNDELHNPVYSSGHHELSTFSEQPRSITAGRMWRATRYAQHGEGVIPGDSQKSEMPYGVEL